MGDVYAALRARFPKRAPIRRGLRLAWPDRWLHVRPRDEPIIRFIAEAPRAPTRKN